MRDWDWSSENEDFDADLDFLDEPDCQTDLETLDYQDYLEFLDELDELDEQDDMNEQEDKILEEQWAETKDITEVMTSNESLVGDGLNRRVVANHTAYAYMEAANYEHEGQGAIMNYSGVEDDIFSALAEHEDWQPGYDY
jgi:hypothetical protein